MAEKSGSNMVTAKWFWVHVWEGRSVSYIRWLKSCTQHILHIAKYKSALESTRQPTLVACRDGLSNLENASVPSLRPAFQSALYHAMKRKKKNNQWELAKTVFNTKVMKWWRRIAWFYNVAWVTCMNAAGMSIQWMNAAYQKSNPSPNKNVALVILSCRVINLKG